MRLLSHSDCIDRTLAVRKRTIVNSSWYVYSRML